MAATRWAALGLLLAAALLLGGADAGRKTAPELAFPSLTNCIQKADSTPFRVNQTVTTSTPGNTYCFGLYTAKPASTSGCGATTKLERIQLWTKYADRSNITTITLRDASSSTTVFAAWPKKDGAYVDELVVSLTKLNYNSTYVGSAKPHVCFTLKANVSLEKMCQGPAGKCTFALYSVGGGGKKCCPVYQPPVPADD